MKYANIILILTPIPLIFTSDFPLAADIVCEQSLITFSEILDTQELEVFSAISKIISMGLFVYIGTVGNESWKPGTHYCRVSWWNAGY